MLQGNDGLPPISFSPSWVEKETLLYRYLTKKIDVPIKIDPQGSILVNTPTQHLQILRKYLLTGEVLLDDIEVLVKELDYWGIYSLKAEYPSDYLRIKLQEDWYRRNLYSPEFSNKIQDNHYRLIQLDDKVLKDFPLIPDLHFLYPKEIVHDIKETVNISELSGKPKIPETKKVKNVDSYLRHSYDRPDVVFRGTKEEGQKTLTNKVLALAARIRERDQIFENVLRESVRKHKSYHYDKNRGLTKHLSLYYSLYSRMFQHSIIHRIRINEDFVIETLRDHKQNMCIAGGFVLNQIIDCRQKRSDYDIFFYGLTEEEANDKILTIINVLNNAVYNENETYRDTQIIRTENAVTVKFINRGGISIYTIQIILRLYKSLSEIIHGFDVDCCCVAYDWENIWMTERAHHSLVHMLNFVDFDRMSPTYESRLNKYSKRGFSTYIPYFDPKLIDYQAIRNFAPKKVKYHWTRPRYQELKGLDILLYGYLYALPKYLRDKSDYSDKPVYLPYLARDETENTNTRIPLADKVFGSLTKKGDEIYAFFYKLRGGETIPFTLINTPVPPNIKSKVPSQLTWKTINPGEQATGTFHRLVMTDISVFYQGRFYRGSA